MSARHVTASTLPRMSFTKDDEHRFREISDACLGETLALYEDFLYAHKRVVDARRWKLVKDRENVFVYRERSKAKAKPSSSSSSVNGGPADVGYSSESSGSDRYGGLPSYARYNSLREHEGSMSSVDTTGLGPGATLAAKSRLPVMITTAAIPGSLEDAMYGAFVDDTASLRRRSAYQQDLAEDLAMLAVIDSPTREDPFAFLGVAWILRSFPGLGAVVKRRDFLFLQRTGLARTSRGERVGFALMQSVAHRDLPELLELGIIRASMTVCALYRQMGEQVVDVFMQTVMHPGGQVANFFIVPETATAMLAAGKPMACAHKKKLFWRMRKHAAKAAARDTDGGLGLGSSSMRGAMPLSPTSSTSSGPTRRPMALTSQHADAEHCASCSKPFGRLFSSGGSLCQICQQRVCGRCSVSKKIVIDATDKALVVRPFAFCIACTLATRGCSALTVHADELGHHHHHHQAARSRLG